MTLKERPLINAVANPEPIATPGHPILAGMFGAFFCGVFGAIVMIFAAVGRAVVEPAALLGPIRAGVYGGFLVAGGAAILLLVRSLGAEPPDRRIQFGHTFGALVCIAIITGLDIAFGEEIARWLSSQPPVIRNYPGSG